MTDHDKAVVYDLMADYLRKNGWSVVRVWRHPVDGTLRESWQHATTNPYGECDLMAAFTVERWKDAPKQGERMARTLAELNHTIEEKQRAVVRHVAWVTKAKGRPPQIIGACGETSEDGIYVVAIEESNCDKCRAASVAPKRPQS